MGNILIGSFQHSGKLYQHHMNLLLVLFLFLF